MATKKSSGISVVHVFGLILLILLAGFGYKWFKGYQKRAAAQAEADRVAALRVTLDKDKAKLVEVLRKWDDAIKLASITSRIALAQPVSQMQAVRREMQDLKTNACFDNASKKIVEGMNLGLTGFEEFATGSGVSAEYAAQAKFSEMRIAFNAANTAMAACYPPSQAASGPAT